MKFLCNSDKFIAHVCKLVNELWPVLTFKLNHCCVEWVMVNGQIALTSGLLEAAMEVVPKCLTVAIRAHQGNHEVRLLLVVLHWNHQRSVLCLFVFLSTDTQDEMGQLDQSERVLEQLSILEIAILQHAVLELLDHLDLSFIDQTIAHAYNGLLHFFGQLNASLE